MATQEEVAEAFAGEFMQPRVWQGDCWLVNTVQGTYFIPRDTLDRAGVLAAYTEVTSLDLMRNVWMAQLSAPGYLDCTEVVAYDTEEDALDALLEMRGD
jgi:hypothetical protein